MNPAMPLLLSAALLVLLFIFTWRLSVQSENYSFVDVTWSLSFAPVVLLYAGLGDGWGPRRIAIAVLVASWSLRLGIYLWQRVASHHPDEDPRYAVLREKWTENRKRKFLSFFLAQALLVWLLTLPVFLICRNPSENFAALEIAGFAVWVIGLAGEGLADRQLKQFKANPSGDPKAICQEGLWRYSRHPNYFFQSLLWWGLFLIALPASWGWAAILGPLAMLYFLLRVTGIPLTEKLALQKRGEAWLKYQESTSAFIPLPVKTKNPS